MRALSGGPEGGRGVCKVNKNFVRNSVKEVKFRKMYHFEQVKILAWKVKKVQIQEPKEVKHLHKKFSLRSQRVNLVSSKVISKKVPPSPCRPPLLVLVVNTTGMYLVQNSSDVYRTF